MEPAPCVPETVLAYGQLPKVPGCFRDDIIIQFECYSTGRFVVDRNVKLKVVSKSHQTKFKVLKLTNTFPIGLLMELDAGEATTADLENRRRRKAMVESRGTYESQKKPFIGEKMVIM
jgi:hypothetical protein